MRAALACTLLLSIASALRPPPRKRCIHPSQTALQALPVQRGVKLAANFWIHMYDFQHYHGQGCDNTNYLQDEALTRPSVVNMV